MVRGASDLGSLAWYGPVWFSELAETVARVLGSSGTRFGGLVRGSPKMVHNCRNLDHFVCGGSRLREFPAWGNDFNVKHTDPEGRTRAFILGRYRTKVHLHFHVELVVTLTLLYTILVSSQKRYENK